MQINDYTNQSQKTFYKYSEYINLRYPEADIQFKLKMLTILINKKEVTQWA